MDAKQRLAEIELLKQYIDSRIKHIENHKEHAQEKKDIEIYQARQDQCGTIIEYLEDRESMLRLLYNEK